MSDPRYPELEGMFTKAGVLRGHQAVLRRRERLERVCAKLEPRLAELLRSPPVASAWISAVDLAPILVAIEQELGAAGIREYHVEVNRAGILPLVESFLSGLLRLFRAAPGSLLGRLPDIAGQQSRGIELFYKPLEGNAGILGARFLQGVTPPSPMREAIPASAMLLFDLCRVRGTVSPMRFVEGRWECDVRWE